MEDRICDLLDKHFDSDMPYNSLKEGSREIVSLFTAYIDWLRKNCYAEDDYWVHVISDGDFERMSTEETFKFWLKLQ